VKLFVVDPHTIYRRGLVACLEGLPEVTSVHQAESVRDAWESPPLFECDLVLVDHIMPGGPDFVGAAGPGADDDPAAGEELGDRPQMSPSRTACATAWERLRAPSFVTTSCRTFFTVRSE
jgi:hypothetical protein